MQPPVPPPMGVGIAAPNRSQYSAVELTRVRWLFATLLL